MNTKQKTIIISVVLIILLAAALFAGVRFLNKTPVYLVIDIKVTDKEVYSEYISKAQAIVESYGGRYMVRGGEITSVAGDWRPERIIIIRFDSKKQIGECFGSEDYKEIAPLKAKSTIGKAVIVEGYKK